MTSLEDRRVRVNLITTYRNIDGKDKVEPELFLDLVADGAKHQAMTGVASIRGVHAILHILTSPEQSLKGVGDRAGVQDRIR